MALVIRRGTEADMAEMLRLWREMMDFHAHLEPRFRPAASPVGEEAWTQHMSADVWPDADSCVLLAELDGRLVGQIVGALRDAYAVFEAERYGYVTDISVDPTVRRQGVGKALFDELKRWFREHGARHAELRVAYNNASAQSFWRTMGCTDYLDVLWYDLEDE